MQLHNHTQANSEGLSFEVRGEPAGAKNVEFTVGDDYMAVITFEGQKPAEEGKPPAAWEKLDAEENPVVTGGKFLASCEGFARVRANVSGYSDGMVVVDVAPAL